jgi:hypothetical protein
MGLLAFHFPVEQLRDNQECIITWVQLGRKRGLLKHEFMTFFC